MRPAGSPMWLKVEASEYFGPVVRCHNGNTGYSLTVDHNPDEQVTVGFYRVDAGSLRGPAAYGALPPDGSEYTHVVGTYSDTDDHLRIHLNAQLVAGDTASVAIIDHVDSLAFGQPQGFGTAAIIIDELAFYDRELTVAEIAAHFSCGTTGACSQ